MRETRGKDSCLVLWCSHTFQAEYSVASWMKIEVDKWRKQKWLSDDTFSFLIISFSDLSTVDQRTNQALYEQTLNSLLKENGWWTISGETKHRWRKIVNYHIISWSRVGVTFLANCTMREGEEGRGMWWATVGITFLANCTVREGEEGRRGWCGEPVQPLGEVKLRGDHFIWATSVTPGERSVGAMQTSKFHASVLHRLTRTKIFLVYYVYLGMH